MLKVTAGMFMCGTWLPSAKLDFKEKVFGTFHILREPITHPPNFVENILIKGKDMLPKRNSKSALWRWNSTSGFNFDNCRLSGTLLYIIVQNVRKIVQSTAELLQLNYFFCTYL